MRLKHALHYIIKLISVQDDGAVEVLQRMNYLIDLRGSLANDIPPRTIEQANQEATAIHNTRQTQKFSYI